MDYEGYLICDNCKGYYKLQENESPKDFESCQCGGKLEYTEITWGQKITQEKTEGSESRKRDMIYDQAIKVIPSNEQIESLKDRDPDYLKILIVSIVALILGAVFIDILIGLLFALAVLMIGVVIAPNKHQAEEEKE